MESISFVSQTSFRLDNPDIIKNWLFSCVRQLQYEPKQISFAFMDDEALLDINKQFLAHDYYTDVITFDYTVGTSLSCDIAISIDRVRDNATQQNTPFEEELRRVMIHGVLHCCGFSDKTEAAKLKMRTKENECLAMFHVEPKSQKHV